MELKIDTEEEKYYKNVVRKIRVFIVWKTHVFIVWKLHVLIGFSFKGIDKTSENSFVGN